ncbi:MAG: YihY/virulence factor BrkB family protein [Xanthobacteraceae bacterium]
MAEDEGKVHRPKSWKDILARTYQSFQDDRVLAVAAGVTFYGLLAIFPAVGAIVSVYGLFADSSSIASNISALSNLMPGGAIEIVTDQIQRVRSAGEGALSVSFLIGLALAIWGTNAGVKAIFDAINVAYGAKEERSFIRLNLVSLAFTAGAVLFALVALSSVILAPLAIHALHLEAITATAIHYGRWPLVWLIVALGLAVLYRFGPTDSLNPKWRWISWGSAVASLLWILASALFSYYAANFGSYNATYGSLGAAIGLMTWMWISFTVIILGAELNSEIEKAAGEPPAALAHAGR